MSNKNYRRIEKAIEYIHQHYSEQPSLAEIASAVHLSPYHFQKMFSEWAGVSPKKFIQYLSVGYAKNLLGENASVLNASQELGFSSAGRLHDLFVSIEGMTPGDYKNGGVKLEINYQFSNSPFGEIIVASTTKGVCHLHFSANQSQALDALKTRFPNAIFNAKEDEHQRRALSIFTVDWKDLKQVKLHLAGTPFQLKVWESLLKIPMGCLSTYGDIANHIESPQSARAVGTAIGKNPVAFLIPCHRVIQRTGNFGGYMWGEHRKSAIVGWEAAAVDAERVTSG